MCRLCCLLGVCCRTAGPWFASIGGPATLAPLDFDIQVGSCSRWPQPFLLTQPEA